MPQLSSATPKDQVIPWDTKSRLYELSYGLVLGGEASVAHVDPVLDLLSRKVQGFAHPFGMIELRPKKLCLLLGLSESKLQFALDGKDFCSDQKVPFDA